MAVPEAGLMVTGRLSEYTRPGNSGSPVTRTFCPNCGSGIYSKGARPGVVMLKAGTLDDPEQFKPMATVFASRAPSWDKPREGLPAFPEMPPQS